MQVQAAEACCDCDCGFCQISGGMLIIKIHMKQSTNDDGQRAQNSDGSRGLLEVGEADEPFATLVASQDFQPLATLVASQDHVHEKYCVPSRSYASQQLVPAPAASTSLAFSLPESVFDPPTLTAVYEERPRRLAGLTPRNHYAEPCRQPSSLPETMTALQRYRQRRYEQQPRDRQGQQQHALSGVQERVSELARDSVIGAHTATEESLSSSEARELPTLHSLTDSTSYEESKARHRSVFNRLPSLEELKNRHLVSHYESHLVQSAHTEDNRPPSSRQVGTDATARDAFAAQILFTSSPITPRRDKGQAVAVQASALARYRQRKMLQGGAKSST